jgi:hypothetical protein
MTVMFVQRVVCILVNLLPTTTSVFYWQAYGMFVVAFFIMLLDWVFKPFESTQSQRFSSFCSICLVIISSCSVVLSSNFSIENTIVSQVNYSSVGVLQFLALFAPVVYLPSYILWR